jgi:hypothetical protein
MPAEEFQPTPPTLPTPPLTVAPRKPPVAWQPFTLRGVSAFAFASYLRLFGIQVLFALATSGAVIWFLVANWTPVIRSALRALPDQGVIRDQKLDYPETGAEALAESRFLGIQVRRDEFSTTAAGADVRVEFYPQRLRICSLLGCRSWQYPAGRIAPFTQQELVPWWGAWEPVFLGIIAIVVVLALLLSWHLSATVSCLIVRLVAYFADRELTVGGSWRIAGAAMLPGTMFLIIAIVLYGVGVIDLLRLLLAFPIHRLIQITYMLWAVSRVPRLPAVPAASANPFTATAA